MHEARARVIAKPEEPHIPRRRLKRHRVMVRHRNIKCAPVHMLRGFRTADRAIVLGAAIGRPQDQRLAKSVAQRLQLVHGLWVQLQLARATAGYFGGREVLPAPCALGHIATNGGRY